MLVTGASSGIGAATARAVSTAGGRPVLLARSAGKLDALVAQLGSSARAYVVDCADREAVAALAPQITADVGTPDAVVNNAGSGRWLFFDETEPEELEEMMGAPFFAAMYVTRAFLPAMIARGSGLIVSINAPIAYVPWQSATGYGLSRWALRALGGAAARGSRRHRRQGLADRFRARRATTSRTIPAWSGLCRESRGSSRRGRPSRWPQSSCARSSGSRGSCSPRRSAGVYDGVPRRRARAAALVVAVDRAPGARRCRQVEQDRPERWSTTKARDDGGSRSRYRRLELDR